VQRMTLERRLKLHQDMVWIIDKKGPHIVLGSAKILQCTSGLHALGNQLVRDTPEVINPEREMADAEYSRKGFSLRL
jgi:hypothetical protein